MEVGFEMSMSHLVLCNMHAPCLSTKLLSTVSSWQAHRLSLTNRPRITPRRIYPNSKQISCEISHVAVKHYLHFTIYYSITKRHMRNKLQLPIEHLLQLHKHVRTRFRTTSLLSAHKMDSKHKIYQLGSHDRLFRKGLP